MVDLVLAVGLALAGGVAAAVHRDAVRCGVSRPVAWAALVFASLALALGSYRVTGAPLPGAIALGILGPIVYLYERDDTRHGDAAADPRSLSGAPGEEDAPER